MSWGLDGENDGGCSLIQLVSAVDFKGSTEKSLCQGGENIAIPISRCYFNFGGRDDVITRSGGLFCYHMMIT